MSAGTPLDEQTRLLLERRKAFNTPAGFLLHLRHLSAYAFVRPLCQSRVVLEIGCNIGYGSRMLTDSTAAYIGLDLAHDDLRLAKRGAPTDTFLKATALSLPVRSHAVDVVVAFQLIEHVEDAAFLSEAYRVLRPGGFLLVSTPNRRLRLLPFQRPWNPEHLREYSYRSLRRVLARVFDNIDIMGLQVPAEVQRVELQRVHQNPVRVYCEMMRIPYGRLAAALPVLIGRRAVESGRVGMEHYESKYSLEDCRFTREHMATALDFLAVCQKAPRCDSSRMDGK